MLTITEAPSSYVFPCPPLTRAGRVVATVWKVATWRTEKKVQLNGSVERGVPLVRGAGGVHVSLTHLDCTTSLSIQQGEKQRELAHSVMPDCGHHEVSCSALVHILKTVYLTKEFLECNCWEYELKESSVPCCLVYSKWLLHSRINPLLVGPDIHHSRNYIPFLLVLVYLFIHSFTVSTLSWLLWFQLLPCPACETYPAYPGNIGHKKRNKP